MSPGAISTILLNALAMPNMRTRFAAVCTRRAVDGGSISSKGLPMKSAAGMFAQRDQDSLTDLRRPSLSMTNEKAERALRNLAALSFSDELTSGLSVN